MDLNEIKSFLGDDWKKVLEKIDEQLGSDIEVLDSTNRQILSHSGKQLRPMLSLLVARACSAGRITEASVCYAAASELLHNATLLHDDVADSSDERRGVPTIRSVMGASVSVLVGDYWLVKAMECILSCHTSLDGRVIRLFSRTLSDLAEGEMLQLQKAGSCDTTEEDYRRIIFNKTASLFEVSAVSAAISVNAPAEMEDAVRRYAGSLGLAFQITDDYLDTFGDPAVFGKTIGGDIINNKKTWLLTRALEKSGEMEKSGVTAPEYGKTALLEAMGMRTSTDTEKEAKIARVKEIYEEIGVDEDAKYEIIKLHAKAMDYAGMIGLGKIRYEVIHRYADRLLGRTR